MFDDLISDSGNTIMVARLNRAVAGLVAQPYSTLEEYQSAIYSIVNKILTLQSQMQPLTPITAESPCLIGDITGNLTLLNEDATDTASQLENVENDIARLFNLAEAAQTNIRQVLRQKLYTNTVSSYTEPFISNINIQNSTATIDYAAGIALLPLISEIITAPSITLGISSIGNSTDELSLLTDNDATTTYNWIGSRLELIFSFTSIQIINRLYIDLDVYDGLEIVEFSSSPDGIVYGDILGDLSVDNIPLDSSSNKNSGSVIVDFPPQYTSSMKIVIENVVAANSVSLRGIQLASRQYSSSGQLTSTIINAPIGSVSFEADVLVDIYTTITHQLSLDNVHFYSIQPGIQTIGQAFWYRALLTRSDQQFTNSSNLLQGTSQDPSVSANYSLVSSSAISLGSNITERIINLSSVTGAIVLIDTIVPGSLQIQIGSVFLNNSQYSFNNNTISLVSPAANISIIYQTSSLGATSVAALKNYYTPQLQEVRFTV